MRAVEHPRNLPDFERLSVLAAMILLAYTLGRFIHMPGPELAVQLPGFYLAINLNTNTVVVVLVAALTAAGADWLLRDHPAITGHLTFEHLILPALTAWVIGIPLNQLPESPLWWAGLLLGGGVLILVVVAEYIAVDAEDIRHPLAAGGLMAVSFALFLVLAAGLRSAGTRLFFNFPAIALAAGLVALRTLHLRLQGRWLPVQAALTGLIVGQLGAALHYWRLSPVAYGLVLLGVSYALTSFFTSLAEERPLRQAIVEPVLAAGIAWLAAVFLG